MVIDPHDPKSEERAQWVPAGAVPKLNLEDLLNLHGWKLKHSPTETPILPKSAQALLNVYTKPETTEHWREWLYTELFKKAKRPKQIRVNCSRSPDGQLCTIDQPDIKWANKTKLKEITLPWPIASELQIMIEIIKSELQQADSLNLGEASVGCGYKDPADFCKWLNGGWLESAVLSALQSSLKDNLVDYIGMNLEPDATGDNPAGFEFDVVAIRGYQLFAFSCSTDDEKGLLKLKLFEAYVRARQLGGDEARVALVCCYKEPEKLEQEMRRDIDLEGIRVFGQPHLTNLGEYLADWIREQSKGG